MTDTRSCVVLIVEDDADIRDAVAGILREERYVVLEAENGRIAMDILHARERAPCIVLLDLMMPEMNGFEVLNALREEDALASLPVVITSAVADTHKPPGAVKYIRKPFSIEILLETVNAYCNRGEKPPA